MGMYDTYGTENVQLKAGNVTGDHYKLGSRSPLTDGLYVTQYAIVLIHEGLVKFAGSTPIFSKWGDGISNSEIVAEHDYVKLAVESIERNH